MRNERKLTMGLRSTGMPEADKVSVSAEMALPHIETGSKRMAVAMKTKKRFYRSLNVIVFILAIGLIFGSTQVCWADHGKAGFASALVWRQDGTGDYTFGSSEPTGPDTYESITYGTDGLVYSVTATYEFTGEVTLEVSATGNSAGYVKVVNGVPIVLNESTGGTKLMWRATLAAGSTLTEVKIVYSDLSGILGSFGTPELSGFMFRKPIHLTGSTAGELFHYQVPIKIGESASAAGCDFYLNGVIYADFADVRFTQADGETLLPYYLESITGVAPDRTATFWLNIPQLPEEGLAIYLYYGNINAESASTEAVFEFFDGFDGTALDDTIWTATLSEDFSYMEVAGSLLRLDAAQVTTNVYELFANGIIEYKAKTTKGPIAAMIRDADTLAYSSNVENAQHCIAFGEEIKANAKEPITLGTFYRYKIEAVGDDITFQRFDEYGRELQAEVEYEGSSDYAAGPLGFMAGSRGLFVYYDWVRVRKLVIPAPAVDKTKTDAAQEEVPNIPVFEDTTVAPDGDLILSDEAIEGTYISQKINTPFETRIMVPSWKGEARDEESITVDILAEENGIYKEGCKKDSYYYASRGDFVEGDVLNIRANLVYERVSPRLDLLLMDFRQGSINIVKPNGGEYLEIGAKYDIVWDASEYEDSYTVAIEYSTNGGKTYEKITKKTPNIGRYAWLVPDKVTDTAIIKIYDFLNKDIYDLSNEYFSLVTEEPEEEEEEETAEDVPETMDEEEERPTDKGGRKLYELLMKKYDTTVREGEDDSGAYKRGDIVMIKPKGHLWGVSERRNFVIVEVYLTEQEREDLMKPETKLVRSEDGKPVFETVRRRKHRLNLDDEKIKEKIAAMENMLRTNPLIDVKDVEKKR